MADRRRASHYLKDNERCTTIHITRDILSCATKNEDLLASLLNEVELDDFIPTDDSPNFTSFLEDRTSSEQKAELREASFLLEKALKHHTKVVPVVNTLMSDDEEKVPLSDQLTALSASHATSSSTRGKRSKTTDTSELPSKKRRELRRKTTVSTSSEGAIASRVMANRRGLECEMPSTSKEKVSSLSKSTSTKADSRLRELGKDKMPATSVSRRKLSTSKAGSRVRRIFLPKEGGTITKRLENNPESCRKKCNPTPSSAMSILCSPTKQCGCEVCSFCNDVSQHTPRNKIFVGLLYVAIKSGISESLSSFSGILFITAMFTWLTEFILASVMPTGRPISCLDKNFLQNIECRLSAGMLVDRDKFVFTTPDFILLDIRLRVVGVIQIISESFTHFERCQLALSISAHHARNRPQLKTVLGIAFNANYVAKLYFSSLEDDRINLIHVADYKLNEKEGLLNFFKDVVNASRNNSE